MSVKLFWSRNGGYDCGISDFERVIIMNCKILMFWDDEACVWVATSNDVPGLVLEHGSFDVLVEKVRLASPELLELNIGYNGEILLSFEVSKCERLALVG